ncbi:hypothetical protein B2J88_43355 [Rhodococcus sp. SRB_17]|nr:hypothetical protein [Rhodococcus sp. SRB_17]
MATTGVSSSALRSITDGMASSAMSARAGIAAIFARSCSSFSAFDFCIGAGKTGLSISTPLLLTRN